MARTARKVDLNPDTVCPLFAEVLPPIYAKNIGRIRLQRIDKSNGSSRGARIPLSREDYWIDGDEETPFEINPYKTDEEHLAEQFGCGEYWVDAFDKEGKAYPNGRRLVFGGPLKRGGKVVDEDLEEQSESSYATGNADSAQMLKMMEKMFSDREKHARDQAERERQLAQQQAERERMHAEEQVRREREHAQREMTLHGDFSETMLKIATDTSKDSTSSMEVIAALRNQLDLNAKKAMRDEEDLRKDHRSELQRMVQDRDDLNRAHREELAEERRRSRDDLNRRDQEIADLRKRAMDNEEDLRRRWQKDIDDMRSRFERDIAAVRSESLETRSKIGGDAEARIRRLENENEELRKDVRSLERDNIDLERKLAKAQVPEPEAPEAPGFLEQAGPVLRGVAADVLQKVMTRPAAGHAGQPNPQQVAQQASQQAPQQGAVQQQPISPEAYEEMVRRYQAAQVAQAQAAYAAQMQAMQAAQAAQAAQASQEAQQPPDATETPGNWSVPSTGESAGPESPSRTLAA